MKTTKIAMPKGIKFIGEAMDSLPSNCLLSKNHTGCGGTTVALTNNESWVVCVPYISLINNKVHQSLHSNLYPYRLLAVTGKTTSEEIEAYINASTVKKIMVTYDSLHKLSSFSKDLNLLLDEYHLIFTQYIFRNDAINGDRGVLKLFRNFRSFTFMTASPLDEEFVLEELKDIDRVELIWQDLTEVTIKPVQCDNVSASTITVINEYLSNKRLGNAYFFVNSIDFMKDMIEACGLTEDNTRLIYSQSNRKQLSIPNGRPEDEAKKINFISSTAWEGCCFFDLEGVTWIVSDNTKAHTLLDVSTSSKQIIGRIRDSKYISQAYHIFKTTRYSSFTSYEAYKESVEDSISGCIQSVELLNKLPEKTRKEIAPEAETEYYYKDRESSVFVFDLNRVRFDLWNYKVNHTYKTAVNLVYEYRANNYKCDTVYLDKSNKITGTPKLGSNFKSVVQQLKEVYDSIFNLGKEPILSAAYLKYPFLKEAIEKLGFEGIAKENYNQSNIKRKLVNADLSTSLNAKVLKRLRLDSAIKKGELIPTNKIKEVLKKIYADLGIKKSGKAVDILNFYEGNKIVRKIKGKSVEGYVLTREKFIITSR